MLRSHCLLVVNMLLLDRKILFVMLPTQSDPAHGSDETWRTQKVVTTQRFSLHDNDNDDNNNKKAAETVVVTRALL